MRNYVIALVSLFAAHSATAQTLPKPDHIVIMLDENRNYSEIVGNPLAPYINSLIADTNTALFTNYYALISGSQPNYLMLFSGSTQGVSGSTITSTQFTDCNLGASLIAGSYSFTGYSDSLPSVGFLGTTSGSYARKHNPWSNWQGTGANQLAPATNQPFTAFPADFSTLPTVSFVVPDLLDDMHSPSDATAIHPGDTWFKTNLDAYIQWAKTHNSLMIFGFDESSDNTEHILFFITGQHVKGGSYSEYADNYRMLRTIEDMYHLPYCGASSTSTPITTTWQPITSGISQNSLSATTLATWPVPASETLNIRLTSSVSAGIAVSLTDQPGRTITTTTMHTIPGQNDLAIDVHNIPAGIYYIRASGEELNIVKKVVLTH